MSAWTVVPCLLALREEFNRLAPLRDKGADGTIGDTAHTSSSDHSPDEDSDVLRNHDADVKNEVHALDIDSTGPWPEPFDVIVRRLVIRERGEFNSATMVGRLQYVIWNRQIASRSNRWVWTRYDGSDPHTNHAHFSARYTAAQEADTRPWGVYQEDTVEAADIEKIAQRAADLTWAKNLPSAWLDVEKRSAADWLKYGDAARRDVQTMGKALGSALQALAVKDDFDEQALVASLAPAIAELLLQQVPMGGGPVTAEELTASLRTVLAEAFAK
jgi:hypothetical protein